MPEDSAKDSINFHCGACGARFQARPARVDDAPELAHHPYAYFAECPDCGEESPQAAWERALFKAWALATGPRTPEGKAISAANLDGHPTPEEAIRTRFNALKHGLSARVATYFPARPGKYPHCEGCEYLETTCAEHVACLKRMELFMRHHVAFDSGDPVLLNELRGDTQAGLQALINDMIFTIAADGGPRIKELQWYHHEGKSYLAKWTDKSGAVHNIYELKAHVLLRPLIDFISKNNMALGDLSMTPQGRDEQDMIEGHLAGQQQGRENLLDHTRRQTSALEGMREMIERSQEKTKRDPILIEHEGAPTDA